MDLPHKTSNGQNPSPGMLRSGILSRALACLVGGAVLGCSDSGPQPLGVRGTVKVDSVLLPQGSITLTPAAGAAGRASGTKVVDGAFEFSPSNGPVPGTYRVQVTVVGEDSISKLALTKSGSDQNGSGETGASEPSSDAGPQSKSDLRSADRTNRSEELAKQKKSWQTQIEVTAESPKLTLEFTSS